MVSRGGRILASSSAYEVPFPVRCNSRRFFLIFRTFLILSLAAGAAAQTPAASPEPSPAATAASATPPSTSNVVGPKDAVISMKGFCGVDADPTDPATVRTSECLTIVTRDQFEKLLSALNPGQQAISAEMQRKLAQSYVQLMLFAAKAHQEGIEKDPNYQIIMNLVRIRTLSDFYTRELQQQFRNASPAEIEAYYRQNQSIYQELKVRKISIPRNAHSGDDQEAYTKKAARVAQDIRERI